ncbi:putative signal transducing protein [Mangrovimonas sp. YM274]|uniref:putative signal transducing protein n=1 Tax=Mangrovimonas sp. YM274 TaxID=3070660 RepID=UPI0027DE082D|nr:DUF2007 domain-containing protein [Mangrovimonas sp. YM274]WMI67565.1 DUF2007 domain-containing protein [Mangrovimonas sp. YM274]
MSEDNYIKIFSGNFIMVQLMISKLEDVGIEPIIKDESESGRLAGFGSSIQGFQELYVHKDELDKAVHIVESVRSEMEA